MFFRGYPFPTRSNDPLVFVYVSISEEFVVVGVDHSVLWVIESVAAVVPTEGDLGGWVLVRQLCTT